MLKRRCVLLVVCVAACAALSGCFLFPNQAPVAAFAPVYNVNPEDPMVVNLDASSSADPDGDVVAQYMWAFSDDLTPVEPLVYSLVVNHPVAVVRCPNEGTYTATLVVYDEHGKASVPAIGTIIVPQPWIDPGLHVGIKPLGVVDDLIMPNVAQTREERERSFVLPFDEAGDNANALRGESFLAGRHQGRGNAQSAGT
jgi:hypothetical protein